MSVKQLKAALHDAGVSTEGCTEKSELQELFARLGTQAPSPRVFLVSDLHVHCQENWQWLDQLSTSAFTHDALIVAGDVSTSLSELEACLTLLAGKFARVYFTPGNHDLWLSPEDAAAGIRTSMDKLKHILALCDRIPRVSTRPSRFGSERRGVWVAPLLSFHHASFDTEPDVQGWDVPRVHDCMVDYRECVWPEPLSMHDESVAAAVDALNDDADACCLRERPPCEALLTFSHFLPRQDLLPEKRWLFVPALPKASGSAFLGRRVAALAPTVHAFGHTHFGWDMTCADDGIRYIQAALAYPTERLSRWHTLAIGAFGRAGPLLVWDAENGFAPRLHCRWSGFYEHHERLRKPDGVTEFTMARYAACYPRTDKRAQIVDPDFSHESGAGASVGVRMRDSDPVMRPGADEDPGDRAWPRGVWRSGANPL